MTDTQSPDNQYLIVGPPGVGKTENIQKRATKSAEKFGSNKVLLSSFTRAATAELVSRDTPIEREMIGTLHSFAFHALGRPPLAEAKIKEWNESHAKSAEYQLSSGLDNDEPESGGKTPGDDLYNRIQIQRAKMVPVEQWPFELRAFYEDWQQFKRENSYFDFTDLIEVALREIEYAPGQPVVGYFDEHQDVSKLEHALVAKWGAGMDYFILAGDPDQSLYSFKGSDPNVFLDPPTPKERTILLTQSYRVPRQVHVVARRWIEQLSRRFPSEYQPRQPTKKQPDAEGEVVNLHNYTFKDADWLVDYATQYLADGKRVMFLGACGFHVSPVIKALRDEGIPFHNPYRRRRGDWNPLGRKQGTSTTDRLRAFLEGDEKYWSVYNLQTWIELVKVDGVLVRGAKQEIAKLGPDSPITAEHFHKWFQPAALGAAIARDTYWLRGNLANKVSATAEFALNVVEKRGLEALTDEPKVVVGTIHSVKGGESEVVIVDPSLSPSMMREWYHPRKELRDPIIRQYYVGLTRASETLVVCNSTGPMVDIDCSVPDRSVEEF